MKQLTLNVHMSKTIRKTSFFANFDKKSNLFRNVKKHKSTQLIIEKTNSNTFIQKTFHYKISKKIEIEMKKILNKKNQKYLIK